MKIQFAFVLLLAVLLVSCHSTAQTTVQKAPGYTFKKVDLPSVSPCVQCIMSSARIKYRRGRSIPFPACESGSTDRRYLKLSVSSGGSSQKLVLNRFCGEGLTTVGITFCQPTGTCEPISVITDGSQTFYCAGQPVLTVEPNGSSVRVVHLAAGWELYYETVVCPE